MLFVIVLTPGWINLLRYWLFSPLIIRNIKFGKGAKYRNLLDIYLPVPIIESTVNDSSVRYFNKSSVPVVVFVSGGAWIIGYKLWSALVARGLAHFGILVIVPDYRNFPQGNIEDMMEDIRQAVKWTACNAHRFGGDPNKIVLSGQSAGAHITMCLLIHDYLQSEYTKSCFNDDSQSSESVTPDTSEQSSINDKLDAMSSDGQLIDEDICLEPPTSRVITAARVALLSTAEKLELVVPSVRNRRKYNRFSVSANVRLFIGISGPYNLLALASHLHNRGLDFSIINWICNDDVANYSPTTLLTNYIESKLPSANNAESTDRCNTNINNQLSSTILEHLTPIALFHGSDDATIPVSISTELSSILQRHGATSSCKIYKGWSHTDAILEAPLNGTMRLLFDMSEAIYTGTTDSNEVPLCDENGASKPASSSYMSLDRLADGDDFSYHSHDPSLKPPMVNSFLVKIARRLNPF